MPSLLPFEHWSPLDVVEDDGDTPGVLESMDSASFSCFWPLPLLLPGNSAPTKVVADDSCRKPLRVGRHVREVGRTPGKNDSQWWRPMMIAQVEMTTLLPIVSKRKPKQLSWYH